MADADDSQVTAVAAVAALDEPTRRRLYDHVARHPLPVSRDDAATALDLPRSTAAFHLDRLAQEGLLDVVYERRTGRSGPGAGRPSKLYRRAERDVAVTLPGRRYDLAGRLLAAAVDEAESSGVSPRAALEARAERTGREIGASGRAALPAGRPREVVLSSLEAHGFEPRVEDGDVVLANCPFHALAEQHAALVCGMNLSLLAGLLRELDAAGLQARLDPAEGRCCVVLEAVEPEQTR